MSRRDSGFTLIEVMVALAVFSLAALALIRLQGAAIIATGRIDERLAADIVASNQLTEALLLRGVGAATGKEIAGHRRWRWQRRLVATADPRLARVEVLVSDDQGRAIGSAAGLVRR